MVRRQDLSSRSFVIEGLFETDECIDYIERCETVGFADAPVTTVNGPVMMQHIRNNERVIIDDVTWAAQLYARIKPWVPESWHQVEHDGSRYAMSGLNERLRFYRYDPGQQFKMHRDGFFEREDRSERSFLTMLLYLNEAMMGGQTLLYEEHVFEVAPRIGQVLCFEHTLLHEGLAVDTGRKYVLRSDVMYQRV